MEGAVQDVYGQVKETASDAVEAIRESASGPEYRPFLYTLRVPRPKPWLGWCSTSWAFERRAARCQSANSDTRP
jgi:hypothetical protein